MKLQVMQYNLPNKVLSKTLSLEMVLIVLRSVVCFVAGAPAHTTHLRQPHLSEMDYDKIQPVTR